MPSFIVSGANENSRVDPCYLPRMLHCIDLSLSCCPESGNVTRSEKLSCKDRRVSMDHKFVRLGSNGVIRIDKIF